MVRRGGWHRERSLRRAGALVAVVLVPIAVGPAVMAQPASTAVTISGVGTAHGLGMAMDGVEGQARAGWTHGRILDLFYPGSVAARFSGTITVGLAQQSVATLTLPTGGSVSAGPGLPAKALPVGTTLTIRKGPAGLGYTSSAPAPTPARATASPTPTGSPPPEGLLSGPELAPAPPTPAPPAIEPTPTPEPTPPPADDEPAETSAPAVAGAPQRLWITGAGDPALVRVHATGRRYRGAIEVVTHGGSLNVVNHVDLETYVAGIAEEKGAGWPLEGMKTLAIAARSLGAATMTWYDKSREKGYHICPTQLCQVYLGYDGEEPMMRRATAETAGVIRTYNGRPILAMYHGNGGGQTETYKRLIDYGGDPHPYLRSVKYPFADPKRWTRNETYASIEGSLRASGVAIPGRLIGLDVLERGDSPRVVKLRLRGEDSDTTITGTRFMFALDLWSTWFSFEEKERPIAALGPVLRSDTGFPVVQDESTSTAAAGRPWLAWVLAFLSLVALASATYLILPAELALGDVLGLGVRGTLLYGSDAAS